MPEVLVVISIIALLATFSLVYMSQVRERAYMAGAKHEFHSISQALELYVYEYGDYPTDTVRAMPPGLEKYLGGTWPSVIWPDSVFDWDNWTATSGEKIYQISIRFCPQGGSLSQCHFPSEPWASGFGVDSSVYYCVSGPCRAHINQPLNYPGYCVNCGNN